jgi:hypothetical protein
VRTVSYIGFFRVLAPGRWEVNFPDLPGCEATGRNFKEVFEGARVALTEELAELAGREPRPRTTAELLIDAQRDPALAKQLARSVMHPVRPAVSADDLVPLELWAARAKGSGENAPQAGG